MIRLFFSFFSSELELSVEFLFAEQVFLHETTTSRSFFQIYKFCIAYSIYYLLFVSNLSFLDDLDSFASLLFTFL